jgi:hypothetical protein
LAKTLYADEKSLLSCSETGYHLHLAARLAMCVMPRPTDVSLGAVALESRFDPDTHAELKQCPPPPSLIVGPSPAGSRSGAACVLRRHADLPRERLRAGDRAALL